MANKTNFFPQESRTFETRLRFIESVFRNKYAPIDVIANCVRYKLDISFQEYVRELDKCVWNIDGKDPMKMLKKID
jgi:hypothetical protein